MLKMIRSPDKPALSRNNNSRSASSKNNYNRLAFRRNDSDSKIDGFGVGKNGVKYD